MMDCVAHAVVIEEVRLLREYPTIAFLLACLTDTRRRQFHSALTIFARSLQRLGARERFKVATSPLPATVFTFFALKVMETTHQL